MGDNLAIKRANYNNFHMENLLSEIQSARRNVLVKASPDQTNMINDFFDAVISSAATRFYIEKSKNVERSNRDLTQFASIAAHDLKSPLASANLYLGALMHGLTQQHDIKNFDLAEKIKLSLVQMNNLIDSLLIHSAIGHSPGRFIITDSAKLIELAKANLERQISESGTKVIYSKLPSIKCDPVLMTLLFQNLFSNSIKYRNNNPPFISVSCQQREHDVLFEVQDNGTGFEPEKKEVIFDMFSRLGQRNPVAGSGIGLASCRRIVEIHHGKIWAESTLGQGASFYFTIPA